MPVVSMGKTQDLHAPLLHLNGTGREGLLTDYGKALSALTDAIKACPVPHPRDYYPEGPEAFRRANNQYTRWMEHLRSVYDELEAIYMAIDEQHGGY